MRYFLEGKLDYLLGGRYQVMHGYSGSLFDKLLKMRREGHAHVGGLKNVCDLIDNEMFAIYVFQFWKADFIYMANCTEKVTSTFWCTTIIIREIKVSGSLGNRD